MQLIPGFLRRRKNTPDKPSEDVEADLSQPLSADRPIATRDEDRLRRAPFAEHLADAIARWHERDSLVLGLYGRWGSGKTSVINLAVERLNKSPDGPRVITFNPWEWSGHEELARALFSELVAVIERENGAAAVELAKKFRAYAAVLHAARSAAGGVAQIVAAVGTIVIAFGVGVSQADGAIATWGGGVTAVAGGVAVISSQAHNFFGGIAVFMGKRTITDRSLDDAKQQLSRALKDYGHTLVIIVDDIDRLAPAETVRMLQIIKANADLPRIVFVLAFDPDAVARSVRAALRVDGRTYLDKIVQASFDIPAMDVAAFERLLADGLKDATSREAIQRRFVPERWAALYGTGILPLFSTPREVIRFCSMLEFSLGSQVHDGECDVDPVDFISVEALRLFEPAVYKAVRASKDILTGPAVLNDLISGMRAETESRVRDILRLASRERQEETRQILGELFPVVEGVVSGAGIHYDRPRRTAERRVSDPASFDYYFQLDIPSTDISSGELKRIVNTVNDGPEVLANRLRDLRSRELIRAFLLRVRSGPTVVPLGAEGSFIAALFGIGDELEQPSDHSDVFTLSETLLAGFLVEDLLERLPGADRLAVLRDAIEHSSTAFLPGYVLGLEGQRIAEDKQPVIGAAEVTGLIPLTISRIIKMADDGTLEGHRHLASLLYDWDRWGVHREVTAWVKQMSETPNGLARLGVAFRKSLSRTHQHPLADFLNVDEAVARARTWLGDESVPQDDKQLLQEFIDRVAFLAETGTPGPA